MERITPIASGAVRGFLHWPEGPPADGLALTHGAGSDCDAPLLQAAARAFAAAGVCVLRFDLPFRIARPSGPPHPSGAAKDRDGIRQAIAVLREHASGRLLLGGHSYGGRQASMLAADEPGLADRLLLFSYPLHPPKQPDKLRTAHFPQLNTPALFVHGSVDGFGTLAELETAIALIAAPARLLPVQGAGHDLKRGRLDWPTLTTAALALL